MERRLSLIRRVAGTLGDRRQRGKVRHGVVTMLRQRVLALRTKTEVVLVC